MSFRILEGLFPAVAGVQATGVETTRLMGPARRTLRIGGLALAAVLTVGASGPANAAVTWFSSKSAFLAAAPGASDPTGMSTVASQAEANAAMEASPTPWQNAAGQRVHDLTFDDFTVSLLSAGRGGDQLFVTNLGSGSPVSSVGLSGAAYVIGNPFDEAHDYSFSDAGYSAFGLSIFEPRSSTDCGGVPCIVSRFTFTAYGLGGGALGSYTKDFGAPADLAFVGLTSSEAIAKVTVREAYLGGGVNRCCGYDNEYFGDYLATSLNLAPVSAVPEPATWSMLILGFATLGAALRRQNRRLSRPFAVM